MQEHKSKADTTETILQRLQQSAANVDGYALINHAKDSVTKASNQLATSTLTQLADLTTNADVSNYKVTAMSSAMLAMLSVSASLESSYFTSYLAMAASLASAALSFRQYGIQKGLTEASNGFLGLFTSNAQNQPCNTQSASVPFQPKIKKSM